MRNAARNFSLVWLLLFILAISCQAGEIIQGKVIGITDGDTIRILASGNQQIKVRLYGIDCPESRQAFGRRAKQAASELVFNKMVKVEKMQVDRYGRMVGIVYLPDGKTLNSELLARGMAWVHPRYCKARICREWEKEEINARRSRKGLWQDSKPVAPWEWRKKGQGKN